MLRAVLVLALTLIGAAPDAYGCSCAFVVTSTTPLLSNGRPFPSLRQLQSYTAIFLGRATSSVPLPPPIAPATPFVSSGTITQFDVLRFWGPSTPLDTVPVASPWPGGACGCTFVPGDCYLVFATLPSRPIPGFPSYPGFNTLWTHICSPTTPMPLAHDLLDVVQQHLGPGAVPSP